MDDQIGETSEEHIALTRRSVLKGLGVVAAGGTVAAYAAGGLGAATKSDANPPAMRPRSRAALPDTIRKPGSRPNPKLPVGVDTMPKIEHIVVLMMENHSFDDHFGMLKRGDGFKLGTDGKPVDANPNTDGTYLKAFHMPSSCQIEKHPGQNWDTSHTAFGDGRLDGFVTGSGPVAMGYWDATDIPFYYGLGKTFPVADRFFCSVLAQTYPNRRFLMAGTAGGIISTNIHDLTAPPPANGTIFDQLSAHKISWKNYYTNLPSMLIMAGTAKYKSHLAKTSQFLTDAKNGKLPAFSIVDPDFSHQSEEDPQDIRQGERFAAAIINAVMHGKNWAKTLLIWCYDEHGGYYDHVRPPAAIKPDSIEPETDGRTLPGSYDRYGFRVPAVIVSPYARKNYVSHVVHDHTSILKLVETKWNLPALTYRDANADNLLDSLDFKSKPAFLKPPKLPAPALGASILIDPTSATKDHCTEGEPGGTIPPPEAISAASAGLRIGAT